MSILQYFLNEFLLFGALLALVPVIIHILHRSRYRVQTWGAMMFLQESLKIRAQQIKMQQLVLLILRAVFFMLLALALARPVFSPERPAVAAGGDGETETPTTHVLIIDSSYSLQQGGHEANFFDRIKETAQQILLRLNKRDNMMIILAGQKPRLVVRQPTTDLDILQQAIARLRPGAEKADLVLACQRAFHLLESSTKPKQRIYVLTDRQSGSWPAPDDPRWEELQQHYDLLKIKPAIYVYPHQPESPPQNALIRRIYSESPIIDVFRVNRFVVEVENLGSPRKVRVDFFAGGRQVGEREVLLQPGVNDIAFDCTFKTAGPSYVSARIPHDEIAIDNESALAVFIVERIPVLIIEGRSGADAFRADAGMLRAALTAAAEENEETLIQPTVRNQADMDQMDSAYLSQFKSVMLVNIASMSSLFQARLERYVNQGGGLLIGLGPNAGPESFNRLYDHDEGLLPAALSTAVEWSEVPLRPSFPAGDPGTVLTIFNLQRTRILSDVRVHRHVRCTPARSARVLARFESDPFLVLKSYGQGNVILWTTTLSAEWTNFPVTADYLPLVQDLVVFLSSKVQPPINLKLGEMLLYVANERDPQKPESTANRKGEILLPSQATQPLTLSYGDGQWLGQFTRTLQPGVYAVRFEDFPEVYYAVSVDPEEGDLTVLSPRRQEEIAARLNAVFVRDLNDLLTRMDEEANAREWWQAAMLLALVLLMAELYLGWRFNE